MSHIWIIGIVVLLSYSVFHYIKLKKLLKTATPIRYRIYETDQITTPFVFGFIKPRIYLPISTENKDYIIKHEMIHINRKDYLVKPFAFLVLSIHWFNPIMWISFNLMCKDMEMSCDEKVLKHSKEDIRVEYSSSLLDLSVKQSGFLSPLAFGESNSKSRIKNILKYKNPKIIISTVALVVVILTSLIFSVNRAQVIAPLEDDGISLDNKVVEEEYKYDDEINDGFIFLNNQLYNQYSKALQNYGNVSIDVGKYEYYIDIQKKEYVNYISKMEIGIKGKGKPYIIKDYDVSFDKLRVFDSDNDGEKELVLMFDMHANGGEGSYEILFIKADDNGVKVEKVYENLEAIEVTFTKDKKINMTSDSGGVWQLEIVNWMGEERLVVYRYAWGYGHVDGIADIVSIIDMKNKPYEPEIQWVESYNTDNVKVIE